MEKLVAFTATTAVYFAFVNVVELPLHVVL